MTDTTEQATTKRFFVYTTVCDPLVIVAEDWQTDGEAGATFYVTATDSALKREVATVRSSYLVAVIEQDADGSQ